jgi:hypothetical protein
MVRVKDGGLLKCVSGGFVMEEMVMIGKKMILFIVELWWEQRWRFVKMCAMWVCDRRKWLGLVQMVVYKGREDGNQYMAKEKKWSIEELWFV